MEIFVAASKLGDHFQNVLNTLTCNRTGADNFLGPSLFKKAFSQSGIGVWCINLGDKTDDLAVEHGSKKRRKETGPAGGILYDCQDLTVSGRSNQSVIEPAVFKEFAGGVDEGSEVFNGHGSTRGIGFAR